MRPIGHLYGTLAVLLVAALKKTADFILEDETLAMCVGKALVTALWPASLAFFS